MKHDQLAFRDRYAAEGGLHWNEVIATQLRHRSVRSFLPDALPLGTVQTLVAAASSAPTSSNVQAWSVIAVQDPARKSRIAQMAGGQKHIVDAPLLLVWVADLSRHARVAERRGQRLEAIDFTETLLLASLDAALAAQNALVAAESLGFGTVYIGALRNHPEELAAELGLPPHAYAVVGLVVGHPDPAVATQVKPRLPQSAVLHLEQYDTGDAEAIVAHDAATRAFRREQGLPDEGWSDLILGRLGTVAALKGRHILRDVLQRLGFAQK
ncbi:nitroreductase family protein [Cereibacter sp. SYSU M97828]|nr:nitroreductase family protein [Cereibacter flavus]